MHISCVYIYIYVYMCIYVSNLHCFQMCKKGSCPVIMLDAINISVSIDRWSGGVVKNDAVPIVPDVDDIFQDSHGQPF